MSIGLGLERLGLWTTSHRKSSFALVALACIASAILSLSMSFDAGLLDQNVAQNRVVRDYRTIQDEFGQTTPSINIMVRPPAQEENIAAWLKAQYELVLDLRFTPGVADVQSLFALRRTDAGGNGSRPLINTSDLPRTFDALRDIARSGPDAATFLSATVPYARMAVFIEPKLERDGGFRERLVETIRRMTDRANLHVSLSGPSIIQNEVSKVLLRDLRRMILVSLAIGWAVGLFFFTRFRAALICNIAGPIAMIWTAGFAALIHVPLNAITVVLPLLSSIVAFADTVHLVVPFQQRLAQGQPRNEAIRNVVRHVGPATALTSITTAMAFGSLAIAGGAMIDVAWMGFVAVALAWVCVMTAVPLLCLAFGGKDLGTTRVSSEAAQKAFRNLAVATSRHHRSISALALMLLVGLVFAARTVPTDHRPTDYLPDSSSAYASEALMETYFSGSMPTLIAMPLAVPGDVANARNVARLAKWQAAIEEATRGPVWSRAELPPDLWHLLRDGAPDLSRAKDKLLLAVNHSWSEPGRETLGRISLIRNTVAKFPGGETANISGLSSVVAVSSMNNVNRLRSGLLPSVVLAACLVGLTAWSLAAGVAVGFYVLMSTLLTLLCSGIAHGAATYGMTIALIIGIGIAIDNGIHIVNAACDPKTKAPASPQLWCAALSRTAGPILVSTAMMVCALGATQFAQMGAMRGFGRDLAFALGIALVLTFLLVVPVAISVSELAKRRRA